MTPPFRGCYSCNSTSINPNRSRMCISCPAGFVSDGTGTMCQRTPCLAGFFNSSRQDACLPCPPFTASEAGSSRCTPTPKFRGCLIGQGIITLSTSPLRYTCEDCPPNSFCSTGRCISNVPRSSLFFMASGCSPCPRGTIANGFGAVQCQIPRTNSSATLSATALRTQQQQPQRCPVGSGTRRAPGFSGCYRCSSLKYNNGSFDSCQKCPPNTLPDPTSSSCTKICLEGSGYGNKKSIQNDDFLPQPSACVPCNQGTYNPGTFWSCQNCPVHAYPSSDATECLKCKYPYISIQIKGEYYPCDSLSPAVNLQWTWTQLSGPFAFFLLLYVVTFFYVYLHTADESYENYETKTPARHWTLMNMFGLLYMTALPFADSMTDLGFIFTSDMLSIEVLFIVISFPILQLCLYIYHLYRIGAWPRLPIPIPKKIFFHDYGAFYKVIITLLVSIPWLIVNSPFLISWLIIGWFLYITKLIVAGKVERLWLRVWSGKDYKHIPFANQKLSNSKSAGKIVLESMPQFIVQTLNNELLGKWTILNKLSIAFSIIHTMAGLYRLFFFKYYRTKTFLDAPITVTWSFGIKVKFLHVDEGILKFEDMYKVDDEVDGVVSGGGDGADRGKGGDVVKGKDTEMTDKEAKSGNDEKTQQGDASVDIQKNVTEWTDSPLSQKRTNK